MTGRKEPISYNYIHTLYHCYFSVIPLLFQCSLSLRCSSVICSLFQGYVAIISVISLLFQRYPIISVLSLFIVPVLSVHYFSVMLPLYQLSLCYFSIISPLYQLSLCYFSGIPVLSLRSSIDFFSLFQCYQFITSVLSLCYFSVIPLLFQCSLFVVPVLTVHSFSVMLPLYQLSLCYFSVIPLFQCSLSSLFALFCSLFQHYIAIISVLSSLFLYDPMVNSVLSLSVCEHPRRESGGFLVCVLPPVWNLRAFSLIPLFYGLSCSSA